MISGIKSLFNKTSQAVAPYKKPLVWSGAALLTATTALTAPALAMPAMIALGLGSVYLMHQTSEYAMADLEKFGVAKGISPLSLGILAGMIHTANEFLVSMFALGEGSPDLAISNIVGGSIAHTLMILGGAAVASGAGKGLGLGWKFNTTVMAGATGAFGFQLAQGDFNPLLGSAMLGYGLYYLWQRTKGGEACAHDHEHHTGCGHSHEHHEHNHSHSHAPAKSLSPWYNAASAAISLAALIAVCDVFVDQILDVAEHLELSDTFTGLTLAAIGTALPEAIMTIKAALKKNTGFAFGNVMGCNITNTLVVGGIVAALGGLDMMEINIPEALRPGTLEGNLNWGMFIGATVLATAALVSNNGGIKRWQGAVGVGLYAAYLGTMLQISGKDDALLHDHTPDNLEPIAISAPKAPIPDKSSYPHNAP